MKSVKYICDHAKSKDCPLTAKRCPHKRPHTQRADCEMSECVNAGKDDLVVLEVVCIEHKPEAR
jgi:hypothetical protein